VSPDQSHKITIPVDSEFVHECLSVFSMFHVLVVCSWVCVCFFFVNLCEFANVNVKLGCSSDKFFY